MLHKLLPVKRVMDLLQVVRRHILKASLGLVSRSYSSPLGVGVRDFGLAQSSLRSSSL